MWSYLLILLASAHANGDPYAKPEPVAPVRSVAVEQYLQRFDRVLHRRLGRRTLRSGGPLSVDNPGDLLGSAAGEAAVDWSMWALRNAHGPSLAVVHLGGRPGSRSAVDAADGFPVQRASTTETPTNRTVHAHRAPVPRTTPPSFDLALSPKIPAADSEQPLDAVVQARASGVGVSSWRLSTQPLSKTWSIWMRQQVVRGVSLVAAADSAPKRPEVAGLSGGALVRAPQAPWRVYARYAHAPQRNARATEHEVALTLSIAPTRRRGLKRRPGPSGEEPDSP